MRRVYAPEELEAAFDSATAESTAAFGDGRLYLEKLITGGRHIEFQVVCDGKGEAFVLGERECSIQRRHQKLLEEAPSIAVSDELRNDMSRTIERAMKESEYRSLGTLEFLMDERENLYFMEMNTRIQVEHPVTELVTGVDLVMEQIRIAAGKPPEIPGHGFTARGHSIECRINAEDPDTFAPWPGLISEYHPPGGGGIRVDDGVYGGYRVPPNYDSMIAKIISHGRNRTEAIARMRRALQETIVSGIRTSIPLHQRILEHEDFLSGKISTRFLERMG